MDDVKCKGNEKSLRECAYETSSNCNHNEDVFITCTG